MNKVNKAGVLYASELLKKNADLKSQLTSLKARVEELKDGLEVIKERAGRSCIDKLSETWLREDIIKIVNKILTPPSGKGVER